MNVTSPDIGHKELNDMMVKHELEDTWRRRYPNLKRYTFHKTNSKSASRIDYWLIPKALESLVTTANIVQVPSTDHSGTSIKLNTSECQRGPGTWKMNVNILKSDLFDNTFKLFYKSWREKLHLFKTKKEWWEATKNKIKEIAIEISSTLSKQKNIRKSKLAKQLQNEKNKTDPDKDVIKDLTLEYNQLRQDKTEGAKIRSRVKNYEEGEKSTSFFFNQEKIKSRNKLWYQIKDRNGHIKAGIDNILHEQAIFMRVF